jgi:hypothetical protein
VGDFMVQEEEVEKEQIVQLLIQLQGAMEVVL